MRLENEGTKSAERRVGKIPREVARPCSRCGCKRKELNGAFFRMRRRLAAINLGEMARMIGASGQPVSLQYLSEMERGNRAFAPKFAEVYDRLFERRERAGEAS